MLRAALLRRSYDGVAALVRENDGLDHHPILPMLVGLAARLQLVQHATPLERRELVYDPMATRPGEGRRPLNGRDVVHGVRRDRKEEGAFRPTQGHELGHLAGALGIAPRDVGPDASASIHFFPLR